MKNLNHHYFLYFLFWRQKNWDFSYLFFFQIVEESVRPAVKASSRKISVYRETSGNCILQDCLIWSVSQSARMQSLFPLLVWFLILIQDLTPQYLCNRPNYGLEFWELYTLFMLSWSQLCPKIIIFWHYHFFPALFFLFIVKYFIFLYAS